MADEAPGNEGPTEGPVSGEAPAVPTPEEVPQASGSERVESAPSGAAPAGSEAASPAASEGLAQASAEPTESGSAEVADAAPDATASVAAEPDAAQGEGAVAHDDGEASASASPQEGEGAASGEATAAGTDAPSGKRKRKRKRKRKGDGTTAAGAEVELDPEAEAKRKKKEAAAVPFLRFFTGTHAGKKHGFAVGEVIAGRVTQAQDGAIVVDLFGKAIAVADEYEPREIPAVPAPEPAVEQAEGDAAAPGTEASEASAPTSDSIGDAPEADAADAAPVDDAAAPDASASDEPAGDAVVASEDGTEPVVAEGVTVEAPADAAQPEPAAAAPVAEAADASAEAIEPAVEPEEAAAEAIEPAVEPEEAAAADASSAAAAPDAGHAESAVTAEEAAAADDGADTLAGEDAPGRPKGPLPPAPIVPEGLVRPEVRPEMPQVGAVFRGRVGAISESGHIAIVNRNIERAVVRAQLDEYRNQRRRVQGLVFGFNRGGFDVLVAGIRAFCPASAMALEDIADPNTYVGQKLEFLLPPAHGSGKDIVVSRRTILERQQRKKAKELLKGLQKGQRFSGRVTSVREFGLFVDIGGVEGLVHQSEISFAHGVKPAEVAQPGDQVEVVVLRVGGDAKKPDGDRGDKKERGRKDKLTRVSLSMKALQPDPWDEHAEALKEGSVREGKVSRTTEFGAFIELAPAIEGLLHISELGRDLKHANQALREGETLHVVVERVDRKARRISLSRLSSSEFEDYQAGKLGDGELKLVRSGARVTVQIERVEARGITVRVPGAIGKRARGFIPNSESGHERGADLRKIFPVGSEVDVKVIGTDRDGGLRCSPKALAVDEERRAVKDYRREASKQGFGTFGDLLKAKLGQ